MMYSSVSAEVRVNALARDVDGANFSNANLEQLVADCTYSLSSTSVETVFNALVVANRADLHSCGIKSIVSLYQPALFVLTCTKTAAVAAAAANLISRCLVASIQVDSNGIVALLCPAEGGKSFIGAEATAVALAVATYRHLIRGKGLNDRSQDQFLRGLLDCCEVLLDDGPVALVSALSRTRGTQLVAASRSCCRVLRRDILLESSSGITLAFDDSTPGGDPAVPGESASKEAPPRLLGVLLACSRLAGPWFAAELSRLQMTAAGRAATLSQALAKVTGRPKAASAPAGAASAADTELSRDDATAMTSQSALCPVDSQGTVGPWHDASVSRAATELDRDMRAQGAAHRCRLRLGGPVPLCPAEAAALSVCWTARQAQERNGDADAVEEIAVALWSGCNLLKLAGDAAWEAAEASKMLQVGGGGGAVVVPVPVAAAVRVAVLWLKIADAAAAWVQCTAMGPASSGLERGPWTRRGLAALREAGVSWARAIRSMESLPELSKSDGAEIPREEGAPAGGSYGAAVSGEGRSGGGPSTVSGSGAGVSGERASSPPSPSTGGAPLSHTGRCMAGALRVIEAMLGIKRGGHGGTGGYAGASSEPAADGGEQAMGSGSGQAGGPAAKKARVG